MSEPKRIALTTLVSVGSGTAEGASTASSLATSALPPTTKKDKKSAGEVAKTQRFSLTLPDSTEKSCPEFNFADLIASLPKKKESSHVTNGSTPGGPGKPSTALDPFAEDDEDHLRSMAKKFEEKYGMPATKKKKSRKYDDYVDLGAGYDETDPFIDNTDAYDEIVPAEVTTVHGGFYINSGALEFKPVEKRSDSESESESSSSESEDSDDSLSESSATPVTTNKKRRVIDSDSDSDSDSSKSKGEVQLNGRSETDDAQKKKMKLDESPHQQQAKRKKVSPSTGSANDAGSASKKSRPSVKELLQLKREKEGATETADKVGNKAVNHVSPAVATVPPASVVPTATSAVTVKELLQLKRDREGQDQPPSGKSGPANASITPSANTTDDTSSESSGSSSDSSESESGGEEEEEENKDGVPRETDTKLPSNLTNATLTAIEEIKKAAASSEQQGKCRFFSPEVNRLLLAIELQARQYSCSKRQAIYTHLAGFLPCTKHTLLKRAKNLVLEDVDAKLKPAIRKLQLAVEKVIGEQIERHATQCQRLAEAKDPDLEPAGGTDDEGKKGERSNKQPQPRRRFQWSKEIRAILNQVVYLKAECFHWSKLRKESASEYLMRFLDTEIRQLWPKGWMTAKILFKESAEGHAFVTSKSKLIPGTKKVVTPRTGLVDTLAPQSSSTQFTPSLPAPPADAGASSTTPSIAREIKKSQLKDRMMSLTAATTTPSSRPDPSTLRKEHSPLVLPPVKPEKSRSEGNGPIKQESTTKHRQRPDPTCSAARTEIHHITKTDAGKSVHRLENHPVAESNPVRSDRPSADASKLRAEPSKVVQQIPSRVDSATGKMDGSFPSKPSKQESQKANAGGARVIDLNKSLPSDPETKHRHDQNRSLVDSISTKPDNVQTESSPSVAAPSSRPVKCSKASPNVSSSPATSLASFVDSGLRWKEQEPAVLDLSSEDPQPPRQTPKTIESCPSQPKAPTPVPTSSVNPPKIDETEDQESLLQRDLAMVLEEISQITRQVEDKGPSPPLQQPQQQPQPQQQQPQRQQQQQQQSQVSAKPTESRTKSVIKTAGRSSPVVSAPPLTPNVAATPKLLPPVTTTPIPPPKLTAATRTPPPAPTPPAPTPPAPTPPTSSPSLSRISPTSNASLGRVASSTQSFAPSVSVSGSSAAGHTPFVSNMSKSVLGADFMSPPAAHTSTSRHHLSAYYGNEHMSPEKKKVDSFTHAQQQQQLLLPHTSPPIPAHQQLGNAGSVSRSSPSTIFRNFPTSSSQIMTSPTINNSVVRSSTSSHSIESLMQLKKSPTDPLPAHRSLMNSLQPQQAIHQLQSQSHLHSSNVHSIPKQDPALAALYMSQKNAPPTNPHTDYSSFYPHTGTGHHQHSS